MCGPTMHKKAYL